MSEIRKSGVLVNTYFHRSDEFRIRHEGKTPIAMRKKKGQFFTPLPIASYMASLFTRLPSDCHILDPGAGVGTLTAAICQRVLACKNRRNLTVILYETDSSLIRLLNENLKQWQSILQKCGHKLLYDIRNRDFILSNPSCEKPPHFFDQVGNDEEFDLVIMNPPYFKVAGNSAYSRAMQHVIHGQPNIYSLFMALAAEFLCKGGQMVAITPRSFCNGLYFRGFRRWFIDRMSLRLVHLFESRSEAFKSSNVLQENVITYWVKSNIQSKTVKITRLLNPNAVGSPSVQTLDSKLILDNTCGNSFIRIPENYPDVDILKLVDKWPNRFSDLNLRISTGPVVSFRAKKYLRKSHKGSKIIPLISQHNIHPYKISWPVSKNDKPTSFQFDTEVRHLVLPTANYVLLRRFTVKEERRRLVAGPLLKANFTQSYIALENHLNYVWHVNKDLSEGEVLGITALFNSALFDRYYRAISGSTQVNANEIRTLRFPDWNAIMAIGKALQDRANISHADTEELVLGHLGVSEHVSKYLMELVQWEKGK